VRTKERIEIVIGGFIRSSTLCSASPYVPVRLLVTLSPREAALQQFPPETRESQTVEQMRKSIKAENPDNVIRIPRWQTYIG